jgi:hypothetical protein
MVGPTKTWNIKQNMRQLSIFFIAGPTNTINTKQNKRSLSIIFFLQRKYLITEEKVYTPTKIACILQENETQLVC